MMLFLLRVFKYFIVSAVLFFVIPVGTARADRAAASCVQSQLYLLKFYDGKVDGRLGKKTKTAIEEYQKFVIQSDQLKHIGLISSSGISESLADSSEDLLSYWCSQIAARYTETIEYLISYNEIFGSGVVMLQSAKFTPIASGNMYSVSVDYSVFGSSAVEVTELCILVEAGEFYCYKIDDEAGPNFKRTQPSISTREKSVGMVLNTSQLSFNVDIQLNYVSGGRKSTSNFLMAITKDCELEVCESE